MVLELARSEPYSIRASRKETIPPAYRLDWRAAFRGTKLFKIWDANSLRSVVAVRSEATARSLRRF